MPCHIVTGHMASQCQQMLSLNHRIFHSPHLFSFDLISAYTYDFPALRLIDLISVSPVLQVPVKMVEPVAVSWALMTTRNLPVLVSLYDKFGEN